MVDPRPHSCAVNPLTSDVTEGPGRTTFALSGGPAAFLRGEPNDGFTLFPSRPIEPGGVSRDALRALLPLRGAGAVITWLSSPTGRTATFVVYGPDGGWGCSKDSIRYRRGMRRPGRLPMCST